MSIIPAADFTDYIRDEIGATGSAMITQAQNAAETIVREYCGRSFALTAATATARVYGPKQYQQDDRVLRVHDFTDTASLIVSNYGMIIAATAYQLEPLNGLDMAEQAVPYQQIRLLYNTWLRYEQRATVTITAKWGWTAVPAPVVEAIKQIGKDMIQMRDTKFGYTLGEFGAISAGRNWSALNALAPFRRAEAFGIA